MSCTHNYKGVLGFSDPVRTCHKCGNTEVYARTSNTYYREWEPWSSYVYRRKQARYREQQEASNQIEAQKIFDALLEEADL